MEGDAINMNNWKKLVTGTLLTAMLWTGTAYAESNPAVEGHGKHHHEHGGKQELTDEQKQTLQAAGVDLQALRQMREQMRETMKAIRADKETLKSLVDNSKDEKLQQQVHSDLAPMHEQWKQIKQLREQHKAMRPEMKAALDAKDTKKIKELYAKMEANAKQQQKLLQNVQASLRAEVQKVQSQTKK